jgi:hypothetical protein
LEIAFDKNSTSSIAGIDKAGHRLTIYTSQFSKQSKHGKLTTLVHELSHIKSFQNFNTAQISIEAITPSKIGPNKEEETSVRAEQEYSKHVGLIPRKSYYDKSVDE